MLYLPAYRHETRDSIAVKEPHSAKPEPRRRRRLPADWLLYGLLMVQGVLLLSERYPWFAMNDRKGQTVLIAVAVTAGSLLLVLVWFLAAVARRRRMPLSLRSLPLVALVVVIPCSWFVVKIRQADGQRELRDVIWAADGSVYYDCEYDDGRYLPGVTPPGPAWLRQWLGIDFFADVVGVSTHRKMLSSRSDPLGLDYRLRESSFADSGITYAPGFLDDDTLEHLQGFPKLRELRLMGTHVTDAGLERLEDLPNLRHLDLRLTQVTDEGVDRLQEALPECRIER